MNTLITTTARSLVSKRGSWLVLGGVVVLVALLFGLLSGAGEDRANETAPPDSESTQVDETLQKFPEADQQSVMVVASRDDDQALSQDDQAELKTLGDNLGEHIADGDGAEGTTDDPASSAAEDQKVSGPTMSEDGRAALLMVPITVGLNNADTAETGGPFNLRGASRVVRWVSQPVT